MQILESKVGEKEIPGPEYNAFIVECHQTTTLKATDDETPWCSSAVNWSMRKAGIPGTDSAAAISWKDWGVNLDLPREGCVVVIRQRKKGTDKATGSSSGYHVALFVKVEDNRIYLLGGNQSDMVKVSSFGLSSYEVIAYRWPKEIA